MTQEKNYRLSIQELRNSVDSEHLNFKTTQEIEPTEEFLGQKRAKFSLKMGLSTHKPNHNMIVVGEPSTGKLGLTTKILKEFSACREAPLDWIYVNNFKDSRKPWAIQLPPGTSKALKSDIEDFIDNLIAITPALFENPSYHQQRTTIDKSFSTQYEKAIDDIENLAKQKGFALFQSNHSITFNPIQDGKAIDESQLALVSDEDKSRYAEAVKELEEALSHALLELPRWKRESNEKLKKLHQETFLRNIKPMIADLEKKYSGQPGVLFYLEEMKNHLVKFFLSGCRQIEKSEHKEEIFNRSELVFEYLPKLLVENDSDLGAPVIYEPHPTYGNLFGFIEPGSDPYNGNATFQNIEAGALHRANGGYLILDLDKVLSQSSSWEALKRALRTMVIKIDPSLAEDGQSASVALNLHSIPLDTKIVLISDRDTYYELQEQDNEFSEIFSILVDFDEVIERNTETIEHFSRLLKNYLDSSHYADLTAHGVTYLIEHSSRLCEDQRYLSARVSQIFELIGDADIIRKETDDAFIDQQHLATALEYKKYRNNRVAELILDDMLDGKIHISTQGSAIGMINGLTVIQIGDSNFGSPSRITTTVYPGETGIVDIERESDLGESIHSKGIMILTGYLGSRYSADFKLCFSANITLEQSYGMIDGDSAALAEVCALISAISQTPIDQSIAVTGSINQYGEVQAVGSVNEKIEGFYSLCKARGFSGKQGVIIPKVNINNLMLQAEVIESVKNDEFYIYSVNHVDEALSILCDIPLGIKDRTHQYPRNSLNYRVISRLKAISEISNQNPDKLQ